MPLPQLKSISQKTKIPLDELEIMWKESKEIVKKEYNREEWGIIQTIFKNKIKAYLKKKK